MTVAKAAPDIPQWNPKIKTGSRMILMMAPDSMEAMDQAGLPSARITEFIMFISILAGKKARMMLKYSTAIPIVFSDAPNRVRIRSFSGKKTAIRIRLTRRVIVMPLPIQAVAFFVSFFPWQIFR